MVPSQTQADTRRMRAHRSFATEEEDPLDHPAEISVLAFFSS